MKWSVAFIVGFLLLTGFNSQAEARHRGHYGHHQIHRHHHNSHRGVYRHHHHHGIHRVHAVHRLAPVTMLPHPSGCPHVAFCGCGAALEVFGHDVRRLWLAANWFAFPRATPAPGMVGVRQHHVFVLKQQLSGNIWMANDYNSGGHMSRYHAVDISRYTIVNPR
jgi:hypothetical protein